MEHYLIVGLVAVAGIVALTVLAPKFGVAPPLALILLGVGMSFLPGWGGISVPGEVILVGLLPPLLYGSAVCVPVVEFRRDLVAVGALAVVLVVGTAVGVGVLLYQFLPHGPGGVSLTTCIALGAVLSPTDAVATTIVKRLGVPSRIVTLLDGESLLNDATSLVLLRAAVAATMANADSAFLTGGSLRTLGLEFVQAAVVATVVGLVVGVLAVRLRQHIHNTAATTAVSFSIPFVAYVPSEELGASGLVAVVVAGLVSNQLAPHRLPAKHRMTEEANWRTIEFLLEGAVFLLMGLQFKTLVDDVRDHSTDSLALAFGLGALGIVATIVARGVFVTVLGLARGRSRRRKVRRKERLETVGDALGVDMSDPQSWSAEDLAAVRLAGRPPNAPVEGPIGRRRRRRGPRDQSPERAQHRFERVRAGLSRYMADVNYLMRQPIGPREGVLLVWAGMRGVVTLAAAQTLSDHIGHRSLLILIAFTVAAGSMLLQGGTLAWVAKALKLTGQDTTPEGEREALDEVLAQAALAALADPDLRLEDGTPYDPRVVAIATLRLETTQPTGGSPDDDQATRIDDGSPDEVAQATPLDGGPPDDDAQATPADAGPPDDDAQATPVDAGSPDDADQATPPTGGSPDGALDADRDEAGSDAADRQRQQRELRWVMLHAMREAVLEARSLGTYSHKTLSDALAVLDADEIGLELRARATE